MDINQNPEQIERDKIDKLLRVSGWAVQDKKEINLNEKLGVAIREYQTDIGLADYVLFVDAKPEGIKPERHLHQIIISTDPNENGDYREIIEAAKDIQEVSDDHYFINDMIERIGMNRSAELAKIVDLIS